ncbi:Ribosomal RNA small subunit methyltransferase E [Burkholderiales bacterium]|nr:Ribosomal RNA small subunit methyltransferase E [Burkholderiales bacterium]
MPRLYVDPGDVALAAGVTVDLPEDAAHHALRVLRLRDGEAVTLFDGSGGEWCATIASAGRRGATASVGEHVAVERESSLAVTLALATLATDAMDYAVRKSVELGAAAIVPVLAARSQGTSRVGRRADHWRRVVIAACEQCGRNRVPPVAAPRPLADWLAARDARRAGIVFAPGGSATIADAEVGAAVDVLVGPEGGLIAAEVDAATRSGMRATRLGPRVLKAETACIAALAALQSLHGDLG